MCSAVTEGKALEDFTLPTDGNGEVNLAALKGKNVVLYLYPKDDTPGCTVEAKDFRDAIGEFEAANAVVIGLSKDSVAKHDKFIAKYDLPFQLASDEECKLIEALGSWVEKSMYGRKYMGIDRSTFLIDKDGVVQKIWRKVKVKGHVQEVLAAVKELG